MDNPAKARLLQELTETAMQMRLHKQPLHKIWYVTPRFGPSTSLYKYDMRQNLILSSWPLLHTTCAKTSFFHFGPSFGTTVQTHTSKPCPS